jgi:nitrite reductase/ring-hydroxylating ferredoxin subunit
MYNHGWYKVAFERDLADDLTPVSIGPRRFVLARTEQGLRAFDADCPHRGAHLAYGGKLDGDAIICPFHRYRIGLCQNGGSADFRAREYELLVIDGLVFLRLSDEHNNGFPDFMRKLAEEHTLNPGFLMEIDCPAELVIENGFDNTHFRPVHGVNARKFNPEVDEHGSLLVVSCFYHKLKRATRRLPAGAPLETPLRLNAFSPYLSVAQLGGIHPMVFITSVNPISEHKTMLRFSLGLSKKHYGDPAPPKLVERILEGNKIGIGCDAVIWEQMSMTSPRNFTAMDDAVLAFKEYCHRFC